MKIKHFATILFLLTLVLSCDKLPSNGDLDGKWMLEHSYVRSTPDASFDVHTDRRAESISWNFQLDLLSIVSHAIHNGETTETVARFSVNGDRLDITKTYIHYRDRDVELTDPNTTEKTNKNLLSTTTKSLIKTQSLFNHAKRHTNLQSH